MAGKRWLIIGTVLLCGLLSLGCILLAPLQAAQDRPGPGQAGATPAVRPTISPSDCVNAIKRVDEKAKAFSNKEFTVEFTELEANCYLSAYLTESLPLGSLSVSFQPGRIVLQGDLTEPIRAQAALTISVEAVGGQVQLSVLRASLAGIPIPGFLLASVTDGIAQLIEQASRAVEITRIEVFAGRLLVSGRRR